MELPPQPPAPQGMLSPGFQHVAGRPHVTKEPYGIQTRRTWTAADVEEKQVVDAMRSEYLWRVSAQGENVLLSLLYGTLAGISVDNIRLPFVAFIPGNVGLRAKKLVTDEPASLRVTLTAATGGVGVVRAVVGVAPLPSSAQLYTALTASTLTIAGIAGIAVAVGASMPLVAPSEVTAGSGIVELTL